MDDLLAERLLTRAEVMTLTGLSYATLWKKMREGTFPRSVVIGKERVGWKASEIRGWLDALPRQTLKGDEVQPNAVAKRVRRKRSKLKDKKNTVP